MPRRSLSALLTAFVTNLAGVVATFLALSVALAADIDPESGVTGIVVLRGALTLAFVAAVTWLFAARAARRGVTGAVPALAAGAVAGALLSPSLWAGRAVLLQVFSPDDPGLLVVVGDLVLWSAAGLLGARHGANRVGSAAADHLANRP